MEPPAAEQHGRKVGITDDYRDWKDIANVPQQEIENAAHKLVCLVRDNEGVHVTPKDVRVMLLAMEQHSSLALRYIDQLP